jgi:hypothetical protein
MNNGPRAVNDLCTKMREHPYEFWILSWDTLESFNELLTRILPYMDNRVRRRHDALSEENKLLLTLLWLRQYPTYPLLSAMFGVSLTTVGRTIHAMVQILWEVCTRSYVGHRFQSEERVAATGQRCLTL